MSGVREPGAWSAAAVGGETRAPELDRCLARCLAGEPGAWDRLLVEVRPLVQVIARRDFRLGSDDREDVYQLVCLKMYENLGQLREPAAFRQWLRCLTRRVIVDFLRQRKQVASLEELEDQAGADPIAALADVGWVEQTTLRLELERALGTLPAKYRLPLRLHLLEGAPQEEVSQRLGLPRSTVASQIHRGLARLRRSLSSLEFA